MPGGRPIALPVPEVLLPGDGIADRVYRFAMPYLRNENIGDDPSYVMTCPHTRSELGVPLMDGSRVIGVLNLESDQENAFTRYDVEAMRAVAEVAAPSIRNAEASKV